VPTGCGSNIEWQETRSRVTTSRLRLLRSRMTINDVRDMTVFAVPKPRGPTAPPTWRPSPQSVADTSPDEPGSARPTNERTSKRWPEVHAKPIAGEMTGTPSPADRNGPAKKRLRATTWSPDEGATAGGGQPSRVCGRKAFRNRDSATSLVFAAPRDTLGRKKSAASRHGSPARALCVLTD